MDGDETGIDETGIDETAIDVTALAINATIPERLRWTDTRRGETFTLTTLNIRLLPDGHLAVKAYGRPVGGGRGTYVSFAVPDDPELSALVADAATRAAGLWAAHRGLGGPAPAGRTGTGWAGRRLRSFPGVDTAAYSCSDTRTRISGGEAVMAAPRRRPSNLLALAVLGVLAQRPMHPYEIATTLRDYGKDSSIKVKWGSLYTVVATLEKNGLICATGTDRQGGRPERTIYGLTDDGREELGDWLRELLSVPDREYPRFEAALSLIAVVPPQEAAALLESRLRRLDGEIVAQRAALAHYAKTLPRLFLIESEFHVALLEAEAGWVRDLVAQLSTGTFPDQASWLRFHQTGEVPTDFSDWTVGDGMGNGTDDGMVNGIAAGPSLPGEEAAGTAPPAP